VVEFGSCRTGVVSLALGGNRVTLSVWLVEFPRTNRRQRADASVLRDVPGPPVVFASLAATASLVPAIRAARIDPLTAMRAPSSTAQGCGWECTTRR
jgi:hypothetical protein